MDLEEVILVDEFDKVQGSMEKLAAHQGAHLHRAFSVFLFDSKGQMLLQRRATDKYHCGGLWSNAVCSHPRPGEGMSEAVMRKMQQELGITCSVEHALSLIYKAELENGLTEHEFDHVFIGSFEGELKVNPAEVAEVQYISSANILAEMSEFPDRFTPWFRIILPKVLDYIA